MPHRPRKKEKILAAAVATTTAAVEEKTITPKKSEKKDFPYPYQNPLQYNSDYPSVMQFVPKNTKIPAKLAEFQKSSPAQSGIKQLKTAIEKGDLTDPVFINPDCQLYSLYLLQFKEISILDFLTINIYLAALMQYPQQSSSTAKNTDLKDKADINLTTFDDDVVRNLFINHSLKAYFEKHPCLKFDQTKFEENVKKLNKLGKTVIKIKPNNKSHPDTLFIYEVSLASMVIFKDGLFYIPSAALMDVMLKARTNNDDYPLKMAPIFGTVSLRTLFLLQQIGFRPINLYSPLVKTNLTIAHQEPHGPLSILLHDYAAHIPGGNLLPRNHYFFLHHYFIPRMAKVLGLTIDDVIIPSNTNETGSPLYEVLDLNVNFIRSPHQVTVSTIYLDHYLAIFVFKIKNQQPLSSREAEHLKRRGLKEEDPKYKILKACYTDQKLILQNFGIDPVSVFGERGLCILAAKDAASILEFTAVSLQNAFFSAAKAAVEVPAGKKSASFPEQPTPAEWLVPNQQSSQLTAATLEAMRQRGIAGLAPAPHAAAVATAPVAHAAVAAVAVAPPVAHSAAASPPRATAT